MPDSDSFPLHPLDAVLAIFLLYSMYKGYKTGLIRVLINSLALLIAVVFAFLFLNETTRFLSGYIEKDSFFVPVLAFCLALGACFFGLNWFAAIVSRSVNSSLLGPFNQAGGAIFGLFRMALILGSCLYGLKMVGIDIEPMTESKLHLLPLLQKTGPAAIDLLAPLLPFLREIKELQA